MSAKFVWKAPRILSARRNQPLHTSGSQPATAQTPPSPPLPKYTPIPDTPAVPYVSHVGTVPFGPGFSGYRDYTGLFQPPGAADSTSSGGYGQWDSLFEGSAKKKSVFPDVRVDTQIAQPRVLPTAHVASSAVALALPTANVATPVVAAPVVTAPVVTAPVVAASAVTSSAVTAPHDATLQLARDVVDLKKKIAMQEAKIQDLEGKVTKSLTIEQTFDAYMASMRNEVDTLHLAMNSVNNARSSVNGWYQGVSTAVQPVFDVPAEATSINKDLEIAEGEVVSLMWPPTASHRGEPWVRAARLTTDGDVITGYVPMGAFELFSLVHD